MLPVLHVARLELSKAWVATTLRVGRDDHVVEVVVSNEDLWVAEVIAGVAVVGAVDSPQLVLDPVLTVLGCSTHYHLTILAVAIVAGVVEIIGVVLLAVIAAASTQCSILHVVVGSVRQHLAH